MHRLLTEQAIQLKSGFDSLLGFKHCWLKSQKGTNTHEVELGSSSMCSLHLPLCYENTVNMSQHISNEKENNEIIYLRFLELQSVKNSLYFW